MTETFPTWVGSGGLTPPSLLDLASHLRRELTGTAAADIVEQCLTTTWRTTMRRDGQGEVFVKTGDIPAMWLRDSTAQVRPYLALADQDVVVADTLAGVVRRQIRNVLQDPYANAFNDGATGRQGEPSDRPEPSPWVWERKYEIDSLCSPLQLGYALWRACGRTDHLDGSFAEAARLVVEVLRREQNHEESPYRFTRTAGAFTHDSLPRGGRGAPTGPTGMTWSGFRPSDDRCEHGYLVPANALAVVTLSGLAELAGTVIGDPDLARRSQTLAAQIERGIQAFGRVDANGETVLAYEVDGLGNALQADDANLPSLLSLPLLGWCREDDPLYLSTRSRVLSPENPWYYSGRHAAGVGSPHTPPGFVWPLAIAAAGMTGTDPAAPAAAMELLATTTGGTGLIHESFHTDDPALFTRHWFGWGNAMFAELTMEVVGLPVRQHFPRRPAPTRGDQDTPLG